MMSEKNNKLIAGFLSDKLSKEEKALFLKEVSTNKAFIKELLREIELDELIDQEYGLDEEGEVNGE